MIGYGEKSAIKFNKMFQKHFGTTPKKYQMEHYGKIDRR
jgi:methylphosphotriester-DNA--protein-cysteine methyltransferase